MNTYTNYLYLFDHQLLNFKFTNKFSFSLLFIQHYIIRSAKYFFIQFISKKLQSTLIINLSY